MLKKLYIPVLLLWAAFSACGPTVKFELPQPAEIKDESSFRDKFYGKYFNASDSSTLTITEKSLILETHSREELLKQYVKSNSELKIKGNRLFGLNSSSQDTGAVILSVTDSSYFITERSRDTLFTISAKNRLRFFRGFYFLNYMHSDNSWEVKKMGFDKYGNLGIYRISLPDDIIKLKEVTSVNELKDSSNVIKTYSVSPSRRQFKRFVRKEGFGQGDIYARIK